MKSICLSLLVAAGLLSAVTAQASEALAKSKNCLACHAIDRKVVGPTYKDIAKRYAGQPGSEAMLADKIVKGSRGVWTKQLGADKLMPPNTMVKSAEASQLALWILSLK